MVCESCRERGLEFGGVFRAFANTVAAFIGVPGRGPLSGFGANWGGVLTLDIELN